MLSSHLFWSSQLRVYPAFSVSWIPTHILEKINRFPTLVYFIYANKFNRSLSFFVGKKMFIPDITVFFLGNVCFFLFFVTQMRAIHTTWTDEWTCFDCYVCLPGFELHSGSWGSPVFSRTPRFSKSHGGKLLLLLTGLAVNNRAAAKNSSLLLRLLLRALDTISNISYGHNNHTRRLTANAQQRSTHVTPSFLPC